MEIFTQLFFAVIASMASAIFQPAPVDCVTVSPEGQVPVVELCDPRETEDAN